MKKFKNKGKNKNFFSDLLFLSILPIMGLVLAGIKSGDSALLIISLINVLVWAFVLYDGERNDVQKK
ncbi:hypothetical protein E3E22_07160 [Thermococcus sp. MV5]|uniref:hypothetical protein n=1 Tax=Thermococcus sp. MV5 TaxID=1638272 RepID=UPI001439599B|nr:hypothetical protein [Thermococcus sp. MV5]NJE26399.1 hypothetical protein [Thermococcus sp. MV5]